jgi:hypothetical protein
MDLLAAPQFLGAAVVGMVTGLAMLWRGFGGYRTATRIADTGTSSIASMAAGEVRLSGVIEPAEVTLVSPLQSEPCVYYRATIDSDGDGLADGDLDEERAVGFVLRDPSGAVRVFPRGARWDAPLLLDDRTDAFGASPPGLALRTGGAIGPSELDREAAIAQLLAVRAPSPTPTGRGRRTYKERRLAPGDAITVVGRAMPFAMLADPAEADVDRGSVVAADDPEVLANIAEAREAGVLVDDPETAWGNAAIPGFGIGRPVRSPDLHAEATPPTLADADAADRFRQRFHIAPEALVLASAPGVPLLIAHGVPGAAVERHQDQFMIGLLGAVLAIASALALAIGISGGIAS